MVVQPPLAGEQLDELVDVERVAGARGVDGRDEPRRDRARLRAAEVARPLGGQPADLVAVQALEWQAYRGSREPAERRGELLARVRLDVAVGGDREQRHVGNGLGDELEREQRRRVGPVQVVEDDDERPAFGDGGEQAGERVEEPEARLV